jgi:hypothetical protein
MNTTKKYVCQVGPSQFPVEFVGTNAAGQLVFKRQDGGLNEVPALGRWVKVGVSTFMAVFEVAE